MSPYITYPIRKTATCSWQPLFSSPRFTLYIFQHRENPVYCSNGWKLIPSFGGLEPHVAITLFWKYTLTWPNLTCSQCTHFSFRNLFRASLSFEIHWNSKVTLTNIVYHFYIPSLFFYRYLIDFDTTRVVRETNLWGAITYSPRHRSHLFFKSHRPLNCKCRV